ncbi:DUF4169 family protein [Aestuariivirga sp.]|uniref:DUF4169 family protein n=1 Tax=Aestuariivirga sp. TaxID=2650926 RepID=UPI0025BCAF72|nr:DUF4169 family protein [Aestuariivirga sp.]MCA3556102.1 DUF4169 family protein [Aestuariivirga sp.]
MMGEIVSLKLHRKRKERAAKAETAAENRVQFGRGKAERKLTDALNEKAAKDISSHKREE